MPFIASLADLERIKNNIPFAETPKVAIVRPTSRFEIVTADNPDMIRTLLEQEAYVNNKLQQCMVSLSAEECAIKREEFKHEFQKNLSKKAKVEQDNFLLIMQQHGIQVREMLEDKGHLESGKFAYYTDQIFATDTGQYYDDNGQLSFIPACFKNTQRRGEERLAIQQAENLGAVIKPLISTTGLPLIFEGGDTRQMPGKRLFFIGQGHRSDPGTSEAIAAVTDYYVIPIELLQEQFYHLDCCFLPLPQDAAVIYEGEYELDTAGHAVLDSNNWPKLIAGTETMTACSRALIRSLYHADKLILINKSEALAFATNAALLQSSTDNRFKLIVNGDRTCAITDESAAIAGQLISLTSEHIAAMLQATEGVMDIVEVPYATMHLSGGSVRCSVQEVACTKKAVFPHQTNKHHFIDTSDKLEKKLMKRGREQFFTSDTSEPERAVKGGRHATLS